MRWPAELPRGLLTTVSHPRVAKKPENEECDGVRRGYAVLMGLIDCQEMRELEEKVFQAGASAEALMDKAGRRLGEVLRALYPEPGTAVAYLGRGNNGGDALVALQVLRSAGWAIALRCPFQPLELGLLPSRKLRELGEVELQQDAFEPRDHPGPLLLIDGLLGIGASGPLRDPLRPLAVEMNDLRARAGARVVAVDIPSGLNGDTGEPGEGAVRADLTATIAIPKRGLVADGALNHVGRIEVIALEELPVPAGGDHLTTARNLRPLLPPRDFEIHKGQAGRVGIVAGSRGMLGAAGLAALGALRGGAGLVTVYVMEQDYPLLISAGPPPEAMIRPVGSYAEVGDDGQDVLVVGPGLGRPGSREERALLDLLGRNDIPLVVDADALNLLATAGVAGRVHRQMVLTPHPGEMQRLFPEGGELSRAERARQFVATCPCTLLYKGARTIVTSRGEELHYNSTGHPGMATGGQGDVLSGLLGALVAGGLRLTDAARAAAWLAGRAAELALEAGQSERSLTAGDTARSLGEAFRALSRGC